MLISVLDIIRVTWMRAKINLRLRVKDSRVKEPGKGYMRHVISAKQACAAWKATQRHTWHVSLWTHIAEKQLKVYIINAWVLIHSSVNWKQEHASVSAHLLPTNNKALHWVVRDHMFIPNWVVSLCYGSLLKLVRFSGIAVLKSRKVKFCVKLKSGN